MARILFIDVTYYKKMMGLTDDEDENSTSYIDSALLISTIEDAQVMYVEDLLGSGVSNDLKSNINSGTISGYNATLLHDYVKPALVKYTKSLLPFDTTYQLTNKGYQAYSSDTSKPAEDDTLQKLSNIALDIAQKYGEKIVKYLQENSEHFPLYLNPGNGLDVVHPQSTSYLSSLWLPIQDTWNGCRTSDEANDNYQSLL